MAEAEGECKQGFRGEARLSESSNAESELSDRQPVFAEAGGQLTHRARGSLLA